MKPKLRDGAIAMLLALALNQAGAQPRGLDPARLYDTGWSAEEMIGTRVRGEKGEAIGEVKDIMLDEGARVTRVVVEVGGVLDIGDQHVGVPWRDVRIGPDMQWVQVPLQEVRSGTYALYGEAPQGEEVRAPLREWRVRELIGDYVSLADDPRHGLVRDVIFDAVGRAQAMVVDAGGRGASPRGSYAFPWTGLRIDAWSHRLPQSSADLARLPRFDYGRLAERSPLSGR